ncbi:hypothetical protein BYT27DRAFT_7255622 [Phlegmacium glaucopus]|nr:hypothetical protein BYT27DRAFT_7255622 [Phlegmacium glaucopus]
MPATSADKRARQRANKLSQTEFTTIPGILPAQTPEIVSLPTQHANSTPSFTIPPIADEPATWPTPAPSKFTISYTPLSITYPEPPNPAAKLPTDAVRVTREQLTLMGRLQAEYEKDMEDATTKFAEHEKQVTEALNTRYKEQLQQALTDMFEHEQERRDEEYVHAFELGRAAGIQDKSEYQAVVAQTTPLVVPSTSSATVSVQTEPLAPVFNATSQTEPPCDEYEAKVIINTSNRPFCKLATIYNDASTQTTFPTCQHFEITAPTPNDTSHTPAMPENEISTGFSAKREHSPSVAISGSSTPALTVSEPLAPHAIVSAPEAAEIVQKHPETQKSHVSTQKLLGTPKLPVLMCFSWADDAEALPIVSMMPTKYPRDISGLRSLSTNAFSSLRRRHWQQRKSLYFLI